MRTGMSVSEGPAVPDSYWDDDCPCAKAGEYQPGCRDCEYYAKNGLL